MNRLVYLKVGVLVLALVGVIYVITHLSTAKVAAGMANVGLAAPGSSAGGSVGPAAGGGSGSAAGSASAAAANETINLCRTRVHAVVWPDGRKIQESSGGLKARWQAYNLNPVDIGSMDVEKWLSLHCEVAASARDAAPGGALKPYVMFEYIDSGKEELMRGSDGTYEFGGRTFVSPDLDKAFSDLISLANLTPQGP